MLVVLKGEIRVDREGASSETAGPGDLIGIYETLSGVALTAKGEVASAGHGLRFMRSDVLDVLADDIGLLRGIFSALLHMPETDAAQLDDSLGSSDPRSSSTV